MLSLRVSGPCLPSITGLNSFPQKSDSYPKTAKPSRSRSHPRGALYGNFRIILCEFHLTRLQHATFLFHD
jgi:hypothetical protein